MRTAFVVFLMALSCAAQPWTMNDPAWMGQQAAPAAAGGAEVADTFTIGADADLSTHATTTGGFSWVSWAATTPASIKDIASSGTAVVQNDGIANSDLYYVNHTVSSANCTATVVASAASAISAEASIGVRYDGGTTARNAYFISWFPDLNIARLYKVVAGTPSQLGSDLATSGLSQTLVLQVSGTTITASCNAVQIASVTDSAIAAAGFVGIGGGFRNSRGSSGLNYDNLNVTVP